MATYEEMRNKYYTEKGIDALGERLKTIYKIYQETPATSYPIRLRMLGFPPLELQSKTECFGHIQELQQILMVKVIDDGA